MLPDIRVRKVAVLALVMLPVLAGCMAMRTRTYPADRAGALAAIQTALRQEQETSITFDIAAEAAAAPARAWRHIAYGRNAEVQGVVAINRNRDLPLEDRWRSFAATEAGLAEARALTTASQSPWEAHVLLDADAVVAASPHAWKWKTGWRHETVPFDTGVCLGDACFRYEDVRMVRAVVAEAQSEPYPASRDGFLAALRDPLMAERNARLAVEVRAPAQGADREARLYDVSVLEDGRICGTASEYPLPAIERCYAYSEVAGGFSVSDTTSTFAEAVGDTLSFPFRLVGAAASSAGIGAH